MPPALFGRRDQGGGGGRVADVALDVHGVAQLSGDALARFRRGGRVDDDPRAEAGKAAGDRLADAARRAGDDDGLTGEVHAGSLQLTAVRHGRLRARDEWARNAGGTLDYGTAGGAVPRTRGTRTGAPPVPAGRGCRRR